MKSSFNPPGPSRLGLYTLGLTSVLFVGCEGTPTELTVAVGSDYLVPDEIGLVRARVLDSVLEMELSRHDFLFTEDPNKTSTPMPFSFSIVSSDPGRQVEVHIQAFDKPNGTLQVEYRAITGYSEGRRLLLPVFLSKSCASVFSSCGSDETCNEDTCESARVPASSLAQVRPGSEFQTLPKRPNDPGDVRRPSCVTDKPSVTDTLSAGFHIDQAVVAADLDNDGDPEFIVARADREQGIFGVIDIQDCKTSRLTTSPRLSLRHEPIVADGRVYAPGYSSVSVWRYDSAAEVPLMRMPDVDLGTVEELRSLALAPSKAQAIVFAEDAAQWGSITFQIPTGTPNFRPAPLDRRIRSRPAYLPTQSLSFLGASEADIFVARHDSSAVAIDAIEGARHPVIVPASGRFAPEGSSQVAAVFAHDSGLLVYTFDLSNPRSAEPEALDLPSPLIAEPVPITFSNGSTQVYLVSSDATLRTCTLRSNNDSNFECELSLTSSFTNREPLAGDSAVLTTFLDDDSEPDVVLITGTGRIHFRSGLDLTAEVLSAPLNLNQNISGVPAIAPEFWDDDEGFRGQLMVLPHGTEVTVVSFERSTDTPIEHLWTQFRRDPQRTASFLP